MHLHLDTPGETVWAVVAGAVLATVGGFVATQLEALMRRHERQRNAALMFGEMLASLETIIDIAGQSRRHGDPYGPVTMRLTRAARRETETYERNRASLYDLRSAEVRIRIHVMMVQLSLALDGVTDATALIAATDASSDTPDDEDSQAQRLSERRDRAASERDIAFAFVLRVAAEIAALVAILQPLAKVNFADLKKFSGNPFAE